MAEKKKLTTAEILAMARQKAAGGGTPPAVESAPASAESAAAPVEPAAPATAKPVAEKGRAKPAATSGDRPSVADILAMARAKGGGDAAKPASAEAKPAPKPTAEKPAVAKPAAKAAAASGEGDKSKPAAAATSRDTASILAAARGAAKPGPMSKAEAAASVRPVEAKAKPTVPPMPAKPDYAKAPVAKAKSAAADETRRGFLSVMFGSFLAIGMTSLGVIGGLWSLGLARFMFPNILTEPPSRFKVGFPQSFTPGAVEEKFKAQYGVWIVNADYNGQRQLFALKTVCTHLGCTPNWLEAEQKFKCPCHGSGFYKDGINFEGPAPRPLERYAVRIADDGQMEVDRSRTFQEELGQWADNSSFIPQTA